MVEKAREEGARDPMAQIEQLIQQCKDAPGFVLFAGVLTPDETKDGNRQIQFYYRRHQFNLEDTAKAVKAFKAHFHKDLEQS